MLGFWNKSVYITYLGVFVAFFGMILSLENQNVDYAFFGMIIAAVCDMFDGKVARNLKNRSEAEKDFGVQIDSLADIVAFIAIPAITLYLSGLKETYQLVLLSLYVVAGVIRLAYFNVAMSDKNKAISHYMGLPVPVSVLIFGLVWLLGKIIDFDVVIVYTILLPIVGYLHISKIKIKKFTGNWFYTLITILAIIGIILGVFVF